MDLGELHQIPHARCQLHELQLAAPVLHGGVGSDELTQTTAVEVVHLGHVEHDLLFPRVQRVQYKLAQFPSLFPQGNGTLEVHDQHTLNFPIEMFQRHPATVSES